MASDLHPAVADLEHQAQQAANGIHDPVAVLVNQIKAAIQSDADAYLLMGALAEGAVQTLAQRIPRERQQDTAAALVQIVVDRLRAEDIR